MDWADVIGGFSTLAALVAAGTAAIYARGVYKIEASRDRRQEERDIQERATMVSAWILAEPDPDYKPFSLAEMGDSAPVIATLKIANLSDQPVYNVIVHAMRIEADPIALGVLPPRTTDEQRVATDMIEEGEVYSAELAVAFTDTAGVRWTRTRDRLKMVVF